MSQGASDAAVFAAGLPGRYVGSDYKDTDSTPADEQIPTMLAKRKRLASRRRAPRWSSSSDSSMVLESEEGESPAVSESEDGEAASDGGYVADGACADRSLRDAYDAYVLKTYVTHSLTLATVLDADGKEKKAPRYGGIRWGSDPSTFVGECNSLQIDCGRSKLIVVDVDFPALAAWKKIERRAGGPFDTFTVRSGSGGLHLYFEAFDDDQLNRSVAKCFSLNGAKLDIDLRGRGGCIFAPPSSYTTIAGERRGYIVIKDLDVIPMPAGLVSALKSMLQPAGRGAVAGRGVHGRKRAGGAAPEAPAAPMTPGACLGPGDVAGARGSGSHGSAAARRWLGGGSGSPAFCRYSPEQPRVALSSPEGEWLTRVGGGSGSPAFCRYSPEQPRVALSSPEGEWLTGGGCGFLWKPTGPTTVGKKR